MGSSRLQGSTVRKGAFPDPPEIESGWQPGASPADEKSSFVAVARLVRPQGRRGEVLADILTDFPSRFESCRRVFLEGPDHPAPVMLENAWMHKGRVVFKFRGVDSISEAERLRGLLVLIPHEERTPLPPHHYYRWELRGCRVVREAAGATEVIGTVEDVEPTSGVDLLRVRTARGETLIPLAQAICTRIDLAAKLIVIDPPEYLLELNR